MSIFVVGGTGFIGHRLVRLLVAQGHAVTCMDINPTAHSFADLGDKVTAVRGDVTQFDELMAAMTRARPERVVNLSYFLARGSIVLEADTKEPDLHNRLERSYFG